MKTNQPPSKAPAFQFFPKDWDDFKVVRMSYEAQGIYMRILCFMWKDSPDQCSISTGVPQLARALGISTGDFERTLAEIQPPDDPIFLIENGRFVSKRLRKEAAKQAIYRKLQSDRGHKSAESRINRRSTAVQPAFNHYPVEPGANSSSSSSGIKNMVGRSEPEDFHTDHAEEDIAAVRAVLCESIPGADTEAAAMILARCQRHRAVPAETVCRDLRELQGRMPNRVTNPIGWLIRILPRRYSGKLAEATELSDNILRMESETKTQGRK